MKKITKGKKKGFTLIELIAVIAILAILAAIIIPNVISYIDNANKSAVKTNASTAYSAIMAEEASISNNLTKNQSVPTEGWTSYNEKTTVKQFVNLYKNVLPTNAGNDTDNGVGNVIIAQLPTVMQSGTITTVNNQNS